MLPIGQTATFAPRQDRPGSWNLLTRFRGLLRKRLTNLDPEQLPPHLQRDLGFSDHGLSGRIPMAPRDFWPR